MSEPLDVCFVLPSLEAGGAERVAVNLANGLAEAGARPRVLLTGPSGTLEEALDPEISLTALERPRVRHAALELLKVLRLDPPDVLIATHRHTNFLLCLLRPLLPRRVSLVIREPSHVAGSPDRAELRSRRWQQRLYHRADLVIATSEAMRADLESRSPATIRTLPNPVDVGGMRSASASMQRASRRGGRDFVAVGRLAPEKGYPDLLRAFALAAGPEDTLQVFGEGAERPHLEGLVVALGLSESVALPGVARDLWTRLAASDVLVLTSTYEGMPNAVLEALALGVPVIATTDLAALEELRSSSGPKAVTLVERSALAEALRAVPSPIPQSPLSGDDCLRPSLLPERYRSETVVASLLELIEGLARHR